MKKTALFFLLILMIVQVYAQQISSLQRGLIFSTKLDEWGSCRDEVSGVMPTKTDVFNCLSRDGSGRRSLSFNGSSDYVTLPTLVPFGTGDFTVIMKINIKDNNLKGLIGSPINGFTIMVTQTNNYINIQKNSIVNVGYSSSSLGLNTDYIIQYKRVSGIGYIYINGIEDNTFVDTQDYSEPCTVFGYFGHDNLYFHNGSISMVRIFNYALTPTQIANYSRPEYPIEWVDRIVGTPGAELVTNGGFESGTTTPPANWLNSGTHSGTSVADGTAPSGSNVAEITTTTSGAFAANFFRQSASGLLTPSKIYGINFYAKSISGNGFIYFGIQNTGADMQYPFGLTSSWAKYTAKHTATPMLSFNFLAVDDLPKVFRIDNVSVTQLGCVLDLNAEGINRQNISTVSAGYWWDATNNITATVSGASVSIPSASNLGATWFNGSTSNIAFTGMNGLTGDITISGWVYFSILKNYNCLFANEKTGLYFATSDIRVVRDWHTDAIVSGVLSPNIWYHIVVTSTSTGLTNVWLNGLKVGTNLSAGTPASATTYTISGAGGMFMNGQGSNIQIWNRILDQDQISLLYQLGH